MESTLGWIELSPDALRKMKSELEGEGEGVVDELGVLALHSGYADRFFPGTSVLHTRPRYLFFVCWNFLSLARDVSVSRSTLPKQKQEAELWITHELNKAAPEARGTGIIGGTIYPRPPAQPIDFIYWTALRTFGFYRGVERARLVREWDGRRLRHLTEAKGAIKRDEEEIVEDALGTFRCPPPPHWWRQQRPRYALTLALTRQEAEFLKERLVQLTEPCLLSEAARLLPRMKPAQEGEFWDDPLIHHAATRLSQQALVERARRASAMALLLRAIYGALVEKVALETSPGRGKAAMGYQERLLSLWEEEPEKVELARVLDLEALKEDVPGLPPTFCALLEHVQGRLRQAARPSDAKRLLLDATTEEFVRRVECKRKGERRARLPRTPAGFERRRDFGAGTVRIYGLDYRWFQVRTLLADLADGLKA